MSLTAKIQSPLVISIIFSNFVKRDFFGVVYSTIFFLQVDKSALYLPILHINFSLSYSTQSSTVYISYKSHEITR